MEQEKSEITILQEAGDEGFAKLEAAEKAEPETPEIEAEKPAEELKPEPTPKPEDKGEDDKLAWVKGLDEKTLSDLKEGKLVPHHRFNEVLEKSKAYETLGTPDEVQRKLSDLSKKIEETPKGEEPELTAEEMETQAEIEKLFSKSKTYGELLKKIDFMEKQQADSKRAFEEVEKREMEIQGKARAELIAKGKDKVKEYAATLGLDVKDQEILDELEGDLTGRLHMNKELANKFYKDGDFTILDSIFQKYQKRFFSGVQRGTEAKLLSDKLKQKNLPKPPLPGGPSASKEKSPEELDWNDLGDRAVSRMG